MVASDRQSARQTDASPAVNPLSLTVGQAAKLLKATEATLRRHIDAGAPTNADGTVNLVHYAAWLNQQLKRRTDGD